MHWPTVSMLCLAVTVLSALPGVTLSTTVIPPAPHAATRPPGYDQPHAPFAGAWASSKDSTATVQILRYPDQAIRILSAGRFDAVGYANGSSALCLTSVPGPPRSATDSVRTGVVRLQRRDPWTVVASFAQDLGSAPTLEETWIYRGLRLSRPAPNNTPPTEVSRKSPAFGEYVHVDDLPVAIQKVAPVYPDAAREANIDGQVVVQCLIGTDGRVRDTRVVTSIPQLDAAAIAAVRQWLFKPARLQGVPTEIWVAVPVKFSLH